MTNPNEPAKSLLPYLQRADELQKHEPLVAYYCRLYAMERGLKIPQSERTKTTNSLLMSLINQLEKDKKSASLSSDDNMHVEGFALNVFAKADKQDRAGRADLNTAKTFYAASIFLEILSQFGPSPPDIEQKQKYAVWKAADIGKAIKEGRIPTPGGPAGEDELPILSSGHSGSYDVGATDADNTSRRTELDPSHDSNNGQHPLPRSYDGSSHEYSADVPPPPTSYSSNNLPPPMSRPDTRYPHPYNHQTYHQDPTQHMPPHDYQNSDPHSTPAPPSTSFSSAPPYTSLSGGNSNKVVVRNPASSPAQDYQYDSSYQPRPEKISEARKAAKNAMEALTANEISTAVEYVKKSLELLTNPSFGQ